MHYTVTELSNDIVIEAVDITQSPGEHCNVNHVPFPAASMAVPDENRRLGEFSSSQTALPAPGLLPSHARFDTGATGNGKPLGEDW
jgi:hypothetical protein